MRWEEERTSEPAAGHLPLQWADVVHATGDDGRPQGRRAWRRSRRPRRHPRQKADIVIGAVLLPVQGATTAPHAQPRRCSSRSSPRAVFHACRRHDAEPAHQRRRRAR
jgi:hypothetical protein